MSEAFEDAQTRGKRLLALTERLAGLVEGELAALRARTSLPEAELEERTRLANQYRHEIAHLKAAPGALDGAPAAIKAALKAAAKRLDAGAAALSAETAALKLVTEGLVQAVAEAIQAKLAPPQGYTRAGGYAGAQRQAAPMVVNKKA